MVMTPKNMRVVAAFDKFNNFKTRTIGDSFLKEEIFVWKIRAHLIPLKD
jgi:hypothetical protein